MGRGPNATWTQRSLCPPFPFCREKVGAMVVMMCGFPLAPHGYGLRLARRCLRGFLSRSSGLSPSFAHLVSGSKGCSTMLSGKRPAWHLCSEIEMQLGTGWLCCIRHAQKVGSWGRGAVGSQVTTQPCPCSVRKVRKPLYSPQGCYLLASTEELSHEVKSHSYCEQKVGFVVMPVKGLQAALLRSVTPMPAPQAW